MDKIKNLVFEGGGVRGIAYGGAIEQMYRMDLLHDVENVAGSSAGAITACLISLGIKPYELPIYLTRINYSDFQDNSFGIFRDTYRIFKNFGWNKGESFYNWIQCQIEEHTNLSPDATMLDLHKANIGPNLNVVATNITYGKSVVFNYKDFPEVRIADAVRASMAYPFFFTPMFIDREYYVDGGLLNNFPVKVFQEPCNTIGFNLTDDVDLLAKEDNEISKVPINNIIGFVKSVFMSVYTNLQQTRVSNFDSKRIVDIHIGNIPVLKFKLSDEEVQFLIDAGKNAVLEYFESK